MLKKLPPTKLNRIPKKFRFQGSALQYESLQVMLAWGRKKGRGSSSQKLNVTRLGRVVRMCMVSTGPRCGAFDPNPNPTLSASGTLGATL
jgi:hypothetical protein